MKVLWILACVGLSLAQDGYKSYDRYEVLRIIPRSTEEIMLLNSMAEEHDIWHESRGPGHNMDVMLSPEAVGDFRELLTSHGIEFSTMVENVGPLATSHLTSRVKRSAEPRAGYDYSVYHTYDEIMVWIDDLVANYSSLASAFTVTQSYEGRNVRVVKISTGGADKKAIWIDSCIHAREWVASASNQYIASQLLAQYGVDADVTTILDNVDVYILAVFNVDGYVWSWDQDRMWRKTRSPNAGSPCVGTDPNRNWDIFWNANGANLACSEAYPGSSAFSEVEVREVASYLQTIFNLQLYVAFHSYGQFYMMPYAYTVTPPPIYPQQMAECQEAMAALTAVDGKVYECGTIESFVGITYGSSVDYVVDRVGAPRAYGPELRDQGQYGFILPEDQIMPAAMENWAAIKVLALDIAGLSIGQ